MKTNCFFTRWMSASAVVAFFVTLIQSPLAKVLDDFNDNKVTGWEKFDFGSGNGFLKEKDGQLTIGMHQATKQPFFVAATYGSQTFTIEDGVTLEFQIDLIGANQAEAYAAVGFIPTETSVSQLSGYSVVKDSGDVILAKGLNKFFHDITEGEWIETPENITLSISMIGEGESVVMTVKVLDIENNNAVLFEQTSIDTPDADDFQTGTDSPAGSFINKPGNFVVLLYHNDTNGSLPASNVILDNAYASVSGAKGKNQPPNITSVMPGTSSLFLPVSTEITFVVNDDQGVETNDVSVTLNGSKYTVANGLKVVGTSTARQVSFEGLEAGVNYHAVIVATDADGETDTRNLYFDTFDTNSFVLEVEDYNYDWGEFIDSPILIPELTEDGIDSNWGDGSYNSLEGSNGIDFLIRMRPLCHRLTAIALTTESAQPQHLIWQGINSSRREVLKREYTILGLVTLKKENGLTTHEPIQMVTIWSICVRHSLICRRLRVHWNLLQVPLVRRNKLQRCWVASLAVNPAWSFAMFC